MKYLKLYEGFLSFLKKRKNITDRYSESEIRDIFQELLDDYSVKLYVSPCRVSRIRFEGSIGVKDSNGGVLYVDGLNKNSNFYAITININKEFIENSNNVENFINNKVKLYDLKYIKESSPANESIGEFRIYLY